MRLGAKIFGVLSGLLILFLLVGLWLPGTWKAEVEEVLPAPPSQVFPFLADLDAWPLWSPMPRSGVTPFGPAMGPGAGFRWDDSDYGRGEVRILDVSEDRRVEYQVTVEGGKLEILGVLNLEPAGGGTRICWREEGDFGWNPLMGYAAHGMRDSQGKAMKASLTALARLLRESAGGG
jgi:uncharacterized protein YndB with AHSA1/START domain